MNIYLDMDGVCVDFVGAIYKGTGYYHVRPSYDLPQYVTKFYREQDVAWWANLEPYPWFTDLLGIFGHVTLLTSAPTGAAYEGKLAWAAKNGFGIIITNHKELVGNGVLVDDYDNNIALWPCYSILFPQPWNMNRDMIFNRLGYVARRMEQITLGVKQ